MRISSILCSIYGVYHMRRKMAQCLLELEAKERTMPIILERMDAIKATLNRCAGALKGCTEDRMKTNTHYWHSLIQGWSDHIKLLANELIVIQTELAKRAIE